jgi:AraC-like DNA-binding protein
VQLSPRTFLEAKKLAYAKTLLMGGYSVSEAGERSGFSDCSYFIATFRRKFGQTPLQYRRTPTE